MKRWFKSLPQNQKIVFFVLALILINLYIIRFNCLDYSLPQGRVFGHTQSYIQDESAIVADTAKIIIAWKQNPVKLLDPGKTVYPTLGRYLSLIPLGVFYLKDFKETEVQEISKASPQEQIPYYYLIAFSGRIISFFFSFAAILLFFLICIKLEIRWYLALGLSLVYSFLPLDIGLSIQAKSNALMNFIILFILYLCITWFKEQQRWQIFLASLLVGVATGARLNGALSIVIVLAAIILKHRLEFYKFLLKKYNFIIFLLPFAGLLISAPSLLIHPSYIKQMLNNAGSGSLIFSPWMDLKNIFHSLIILSGGRLGVVLFFITCGLAVYWIIKGKNEKRLLGVWFLFWLIIFSQTKVPIPRYAHPLLPAWLIIFALSIQDILRSSRQKLTKILIGIVLLIWGAETFIFGMAYLRLFSQRDIRLVAWDFIEKNIPLGSEIGVYFNERAASRVPIDYLNFKIHPCRDYAAGLIEDKNFNFEPKYLVLQERGLECAEKLFHTSQNYSLIKKFSRKLSFAKFDFDWVDSQWDYLKPDIFIYQRNQ